MPRPDRSRDGGWHRVGAYEEGEGSLSVRLQRRDGRRVPVRVRRTRLPGDGGSPQLLCTVRTGDGEDDGREADEAGAARSPWCPTTALFRDRIGRALALARRKRLRVAVLVARGVGDDGEARPFGREQVERLAAGLRPALRESDAAARLRPAEVGVLLGEIAGEPEARKGVARIEERLRSLRPGPLETGAALAPRDGVSVSDLVESARRSRP